VNIRVGPGGAAACGAARHNSISLIRGEEVDTVRIRRLAIALSIMSVSALAAACGANAPLTTPDPVGTCYDKNPVRVADCATAHDAELIAVERAKDGAYPGPDAMAAEANSACAAGFQDYVGVDAMNQGAIGDPLQPGYIRQPNPLSLDYRYPTSDAWAAGDRSIICLVSEANGGQLTGSMKGTRR
jgi:hypothetical protein